MTNPLSQPLANTAADDAGATPPPRGAGVADQLRTRVVREARRETWFVVNEGSEDIATIPIELRAEAGLRRVEVNGEAAEFTADAETVLVRPRMLLRAGAGTIVVLHFR